MSIWKIGKPGDVPRMFDRLEEDKLSALFVARRELGLHRAMCFGPPCDECKRLEGDAGAAYAAWLLTPRDGGR